ncbi:carbamoyltransferase family protein [Leptospira sp. GIMC2001]|uniref:carbamoyltransferase family protein n=1 Tax=Leptospira sp. GIMC2001 TaxID=1513297 RepID=UPI002349C959|nr:carbamoyltransferase [Leptospira sp. GIMC2001]WCL51248.1 carbamoyltransferase [Leptospira sp. GIMC2001]
MGRYVLGVSAFYHDSAAAILKNGKIIAAAQEERFTRKKHDARFPTNAINYCLEEAEIDGSDLSAIAFYDDPALTADRIIRSSIAFAPSSQTHFIKAVKSFFGVKPYFRNYIEKMLKCDVPIFHARHHYSHAASAFYPSPFEEAAILCVDGVGEWATTSLGLGKGDKVNILKDIRYPHSLGLLYSSFTYYCGFRVNSGEYKLMGLAPYGKPVYADKIKSNLIDIKADGSFRLNLDYFDYQNGLTLTSNRFHQLFGGSPRLPESRITRKEMDLAASIQVVTEEIMIKLARYLRKLTDLRNLCMAGGVALNCVANGKILQEGIFDEIWIQPAAGDAGCAIGAAYLADIEMLGSKRVAPLNTGDMQSGSFIGPEFSEYEIEAFLKRVGAPYHKLDPADDGASEIAKLLNEKKIVGMFSGRMEFGPRALGGRSILGDPRSAETQSRMNLKIKFRESFRPFAPIVLKSRAKDFFEIDSDSPYMLLVVPVREDHRLYPEPILDSEDMLQIVNSVRSDVPAITHVDYSARIQTVTEDVNPRMYSILKAFDELTGCPLLVNSSFNVRSEPIVCTPEDAFRCFLRTEIDVLVLGDHILYRSDFPKTEIDESWKKEFELD